MTTKSPAIEAQGLTKQFDEVLAVDQVDFDVLEGEVFGFLGPNGAGKTTTINMLTGLARPTAGAIRYFGRDVTRNVKRVQHLMGMVPDESNLYPELTGLENLCFCASLYGIRKRARENRAKELLAFIVDGRLVRVDTLPALVRDIQEQHVVQLTLADSAGDLSKSLHDKFPEGRFTRVSDSILRMQTDHPIQLAPLIRFLEEHGVGATEARVLRPSLEDVFVEITGIELERMRKEKEKGGRGS